MNRNIYGSVSLLFCAIGLIAIDPDVKLLALGIQFYFLFKFFYKLKYED